MMSLGRWVAFTLSVWLPACNFVLATDPPPLDGGADMGDLGDLGDLGDMPLDAPDLPDLPDLPTPETNCTDGVDDDEDGLVDCADFDCQGAPECCADGETLIDVPSWPSALAVGWDAAPDPGVFPRVEAGRITGFFPADQPRALVSEGCVSLALGARVDAFVRIAGDDGTFGCTSDGAPCRDYGALVLSPVRTMLPGNRLLDDLAVRVYPGRLEGLVEVTQAGTRLPYVLGPGRRAARRIPGLGEVDHQLRVELSPGLDERGGSALRVVVRFARVGGSPGIDDRASIIYEGAPIALDQLVAEGRCADIPGLYLALEGRSDAVASAEGLEAGTQECTNPSQFGPPSDGARNALTEGGGDGTTEKCLQVQLRSRDQNCDSRALPS